MISWAKRFNLETQKVGVHKEEIESLKEKAADERARSAKLVAKKDEEIAQLNKRGRSLRGRGRTTLRPSKILKILSRRRGT